MRFASPAERSEISAKPTSMRCPFPVPPPLVPPDAIVLDLSTTRSIHAPFAGLSGPQRDRMGSLPGFPAWEQSVFELLAQCVGPLVGICDGASVG